MAEKERSSNGKPPKLYVRDCLEGSRIPYLRGILTRSLQLSGLPFNEAYQFANEIRETLWERMRGQDVDGEADIDNEALQDIVVEHLRAAKKDTVVERYLTRSHTPTIQVIDQEGSPHPFSKSQLAQTLEQCVLSREKCYAIATEVQYDLIEAGRTELTSDELAAVIYAYLRNDEDADLAHRYMVWLEFIRSGRPLILLVGGTTGSGKSTISAELAHRLNIVRTQSTDMLREVMRLFLPPRLTPTLHTSSFEAWKVLPSRVSTTSEADMMDGYLTQADQVSIGIEGVVQRAQSENLSMIIEGVHIHPALQHRLQEQSSVLIVPFILSLLKPNKLERRLKGRGREIHTRRAQRYLEHFDEIWRLQTFMISEADRYEIPIIVNNDQEGTITSVMELISDILVETYEGDPEKVLGVASPP